MKMKKYFENQKSKKSENFRKSENETILEI